VDNDIFKRRGIILFLEYQAFSPSSELAPPSPLLQESVPPPLEKKEPIRTIGEKSWHSVYSVTLSLIRHEQELEV
jgi:hypothetical protein